jgi:ribose/xylose/arabinose/galactoside ABC-type transport system permease subunit
MQNPVSAVQNNLQQTGISKAADFLRKWGLLLVVVLLGIVFGIMEPSFLIRDNIINILRQTAIMGILAVGLTFVVVTGEMDLSFSMTASLCAVLMLFLCLQQANVILSWLIMFALGIIIGLFNAFVVVKARIPSLLGTIGSQLVLSGIVAWIAKGATIWTAKYTPLFVMPGRGIILGFIPVPVVILLGVSLVALIILEKSVLGRYFYAVGGNARAADHAGINTKKMKILAYVFMGFLASLSGIVIAAQFVSATPSVGTSYLFPAIIAVYLGSIFLKDGVPNLCGTIVAALFLSVLSNGFNLIGLRSWHLSFAQGLIMLLAIGIQNLSKRKKG